MGIAMNKKEKKKGKEKVGGRKLRVCLKCTVRRLMKRQIQKNIPQKHFGKRDPKTQEKGKEKCP